MPPRSTCMEMKRWAYITSTGPCVLVLLSAASWPAVEESTCKWRKQINKIPCKAIKHRQIENTLTSFTTHGMTIAYKLQAQYRNKWRQPVSGVGKAANKFMFLHSDWQQLACSGMFSLFQCAMETCFCIWLCLHRVLLCCMYVLFIKMCMEWDSVSWMSSWERDVSSRALPEVSLNWGSKVRGCWMFLLRQIVICNIWLVCFLPMIVSFLHVLLWLQCTELSGPPYTATSSYSG